PLLSREQVRALDRDAIEQLGVPGLVLMENAGGEAARVVRQAFPTRLARVLIVGGPGQNGGDAWVIARHLLCAGLAPRCFLLGARERVKGDAAVNLAALEALGHAVEPLTRAEPLALALRDASLVVDGLFGTGLDRPLAGLAAEAVASINEARLPVVALDLPSGVDADTGQPLGSAIRAALTVTFAALKPGLVLHPGADLAGRLHCASIGVPARVPDVKRGDQTFPHAGVIEAADVARWLPPRAADAHKGSNGHVLVVAGSQGKTGAAILAGNAALRAGAGLVTLASDSETRSAFDHRVLELMTAEIDANDRRASVLASAQGKAACVMGPGLGLDAATQELVRHLSLALPIPCVLDADALTAWSGRAGELSQAAAPRVLTPHPGEASRLLGVSTGEVQADRLGAARRLAQMSDQIAVLKGARTVVAHPSGAVRVCTSGTPAMGTAGTGDVLAGVIGALCAHLSAFDAAACGVELHARAGEIVAKSDRGLIASELWPALAQALEACRAQAKRGA
ncbi:MAG TPA: NAD(P)H-hydrate dehydratase, partial [Polyangiales bacterium]